MSERINKLKEKIIAMKEEAIREEIEARSKAAAVLAEDFELDDVMISSGCSYNGRVSVYRGIEKLADIMGVNVMVEHRKSVGGETYDVYAFEANGARFEQISPLVKAGDRNVKN